MTTNPRQIKNIGGGLASLFKQTTNTSAGGTALVSTSTQAYVSFIDSSNNYNLSYTADITQASPTYTNVMQVSSTGAFTLGPITGLNGQHLIRANPTIAYACKITNNNSSNGTSSGLLICAGTNQSDWSQFWNKYDGTTNLAGIRGDGFFFISSGIIGNITGTAVPVGTVGQVKNIINETLSLATGSVYGNQYTLEAGNWDLSVHGVISAINLTSVNISLTVNGTNNTWHGIDYHQFQILGTTSLNQMANFGPLRVDSDGTAVIRIAANGGGTSSSYIYKVMARRVR